MLKFLYLTASPRELGLSFSYRPSHNAYNLYHCILRVTRAFDMFARIDRQSHQKEL